MENKAESTEMTKLEKTLKLILEFIRGIPRPFLVTCFGLAVIAGFFIGKIKLVEFIGLATSIMHSYFNSREKKKEPTQ